MKVFEQGIGEISLTKNDFIASGGEGSVYSKGSTAYKIYNEPKKMIAVPKIKELSVINDPKVIRPLNILLDSKGKEVGYTMRYVKDTYALCQLFTKSFKDRSNLDYSTISKLIQGMKETISSIHSSGVLIVDLNEMNFLVDKDFKEVYFIDVDSYQTKSFKATALMESVRDRHAIKFTEGSDWFSFAVVSFQLFMGIHPFKGKYAPEVSISFDQRMVKNISVFNKDVSIPKLCPSFDVIPKSYREWYFKTFEEGFRGEPPADISKAYVMFNLKDNHKLVSDVKFIINEIQEFSDEVIHYLESNSGYLVKLKNGSIHYGSTVHGTDKDSVFALTQKNSFAIETYIGSSNLLNFYNISLKKYLTVGNATTLASAIMSYGGRVYALSERNILEIQFSGNQEMIASPKVVGSVLEKATKMYDGLVIQNLLGTNYASVFPSPGMCYQIELKELSDQKIVEARFDSRVLMVIASKDGVYNKFIYKLSSSYQVSDLRKIENITILSLNFVCLPNGVVAHINDKENLELFTLATQEIKEIESESISSNMKLYKNGTNVYFTRDNVLYSLRTK